MSILFCIVCEIIFQISWELDSCHLSFLSLCPIVRNSPLSQIDILHEDKVSCLFLCRPLQGHSIGLSRLSRNFLPFIQDVIREEDNMTRPKRVSVSLLRRVVSILLLLIPAPGLVRGYVTLLSQFCHGTCQRDRRAVLKREAVTSLENSNFFRCFLSLWSGKPDGRIWKYASKRGHCLEVPRSQ